MALRACVDADLGKASGVIWPPPQSALHSTVQSRYAVPPDTIETHQRPALSHLSAISRKCVGRVLMLIALIFGSAHDFGSEC